jgi:glycosyltransferase involved in cell wall biosynthesis
MAAHTLTICPELRTSHLERCSELGRRERILYWRTKPDFEMVPTRCELVQTGLINTLVCCVQDGLQVVEVPEPLFVRYWPVVALILLCMRVGRWTLRRPPVAVVTFAIDNMSPSERVSIPQLAPAPLARRLVEWALHRFIRMTAQLLLDGIAFGTPAARANYHAFLGLPRPSIKEMLLVERIGLCPRCYAGRTPLPATARRSRVVFLGELSLRKGVLVLLDAWRGSTIREAGWTLQICGDGPLSAEVEDRTASDASVTLSRPTRAAIHALLRESRAVVLPSVAVPRWREQVGLPLLEGEAHGCALVATGDSGLASVLLTNPAALVVEPGSVDDLRRALDRLPELPLSQPVRGDSRADAHAWFARVADAKNNSGV